MKPYPKKAVRHCLTVWLLAVVSFAPSASSKGSKQSPRNGGNELATPTPQPTIPVLEVRETARPGWIIDQLRKKNDEFLDKIAEVYRTFNEQVPEPEKTTDDRDIDLFPQEQADLARKMLTVERERAKDNPKGAADFESRLGKEIARRKLIQRVLKDTGYPKGFDRKYWDADEDVDWSKLTRPVHSIAGALQDSKPKSVPPPATPIPEHASALQPGAKANTDKPVQAAAAPPAATTAPSQPPAATPSPQQTSTSAPSPKAEHDATLQNAISAAKGDIENLKELHKKDWDSIRNDYERLNDYSVRSRAELEKKLEGNLQEAADQNRTIFVMFGVVLALCFVAAIFALLRKPSRPSVEPQIGIDSSARDAIGGLKQSVESLAQRIEGELSSRQSSSPAVTAAALGEVKTALETQLRTLQAKLTSAERETAQLRGQLVFGADSLEQFRQELQKAFDDASTAARPLIESVARLGERMQVDSFRKLARDRIEWTMLKDLTAEIERALKEAEGVLRNLPSQLYVWEQPRFQAILDRCAQIQQSVGRAASIRASLMRILLPAYRTIAQREPLPKALEYARDLAFTPGSGPLSWTMECDGQGISADPSDVRAPWHLRGSKRAGNRTALFPLCMENGTQLFPGVVTYEV